MLTISDTIHDGISAEWAEGERLERFAQFEVLHMIRSC